MEKAGEGPIDHREKLSLTLQEIGSMLVGSNSLWPLPKLLLPDSLPLEFQPSLLLMKKCYMEF